MGNVSIIIVFMALGVLSILLGISNLLAIL